MRVGPEGTSIGVLLTLLLEGADEEMVGKLGTIIGVELESVDEVELRSVGEVELRGVTAELTVLAIRGVAEEVARLENVKVLVMGEKLGKLADEELGSAEVVGLKRVIPELRELGINELGARELGTRDLEIRELGTTELGTRELGTKELAARELEIRELETRELGTRELGTKELGTRELGTKELGTKELVARELEIKELETKELGTKELGSKELEIRELGIRGVAEVETPEELEERMTMRVGPDGMSTGVLLTVSDGTGMLEE